MSPPPSLMCLFFMTQMVLLAYCHASNVRLRSASQGGTNRTSRRRPLEGRRLVCDTILEYPIIFENKKRQPYGLDGLAVDYLDELQKSLGFFCDFRAVIRSEDLGFTDYIKALKNCTDGNPTNTSICGVDLIVGGWTQTVERVGLAMFLPDFLHVETRVVTHRKNMSGFSGGVFFLSSFSPNVWFLIVLLFVSFAILRVLDSRFQPPPQTQVNDTFAEEERSTFQQIKHRIYGNHALRRMRYAFIVTARELLNSGDAAPVLQRNSTRQNVLSLLIVICGLYLILSSEAVMTATLVQETFRSDYRTIADFEQCRVDMRDVCIKKDGAVESYWNNAFNGLQCDGQVQKPRLVRTFAELIDLTALGKCKYLVEGPPAWDASTGKYCGVLHLTGEPLHWGGDAFMLPLGSDLYDVFATETFNLRETGRLPTFEKFFARRGSCERQDGFTLGLRKLNLFFLFAFGAVVLLFLLMVIVPQAPLPPTVGPRQTLPTTTRDVTDDGFMRGGELGGADDNRDRKLHYSRDRDRSFTEITESTESSPASNSARCDR